MIQNALEKRYGRKVRRKSEWAYRWWLTKAHAKHVIGIHTFIPVERWDIERDTIHYDGLVCWLCEQRG